MKVSNSPSKDARTFLVEKFNAINGTQLDPTSLLKDDELTVQRWIAGNTDLHFLSAELAKVYKRSYFFNEVDKVIAMQHSQERCLICGSVSQARFIPIRISPKSHQSLTPDLKRYYLEQLQNHPFIQGETQFDSSHRLCVQLICVLKEGRDKDVDNMAKLILDGIKGQVFPDDKQIDHLQVVKFRANESEEFVSIGVAVSTLNQHSDVLFGAINSDWSGQSRLNI
ncbi:RusA family crossover junction endodeoxyribonuclease [Acaryochloris marina S15]|nr:RusA family crossover junction endodeoxyribonuclease [Acaryochloris marina S15]